MAVNLEGGCRVSEMREGEPFTEGTLRIWNRVGRATGAQAISLRILEFAPGLSPAIRNQECDELLYVAGIETAGGDGSLNLSIEGQSFVVGSDTGIYIRPGQTFSVDNSGSSSVLLVSSQCPDPDRSPQFATSPIIALEDLAPPGQPPIVRLTDRAAQSTADRWYRVLVDDEIGSTQVTQFVGSIPPGRAPNHFHNYEEVLFMLKGKGRMWAGRTHTPIAPGSCIYLPKGQVHCVENTGDDELRLLGVFYPAGSPSVRYDVSPTGCA